MERWDGMFTGGLRAHLLTCRYGIPLMLPAKRGLVILTTFTMGRKYLGNVFYDVAENAACRAAEVIAGELEDHEISVVALSPGWMRVERMTGLGEDQLAQTESPEYIGRAVAALAKDPAVIRRSGQTLAVGDLTREYGFTDVDGRSPAHTRSWARRHTDLPRGPARPSCRPVRQPQIRITAASQHFASTVVMCRTLPSARRSPLPTARRRRISPGRPGPALLTRQSPARPTSDPGRAQASDGCGPASPRRPPCSRCGAWRLPSSCRSPTRKARRTGRVRLPSASDTG